MIKFPLTLTIMATKAQYCWTKAPLLHSQKLSTACLERRFIPEGLKSSNSNRAWQSSTHVNFPLVFRSMSSSSEKNTRKSSRRLVLFGIGTAVVASLGFYYSSKRSKNSGLIDSNTLAPGYKEFTNLVTKKVQTLKV